MKKVLALLLIAIIGLFAFVACNPDSSLNEELVNVTITSRDTRSLSVEAGFDLKDVTTWKYTAEKADNGLKTGATETEVELKDGKTQQLSQGSWNFKLFGYKDGNLICVGEAPNTTITVEKHTITILVGPQQTETGRGKIFIDSNISIADKDGKLFTDTKNVYTKIVTVKDSSENKVEESGFNSVKSGMYSVTVEYKAKDKDNNEYVAAFAKKYFNVYDNLTTTISGTVEETTQAGEANPSVVASVDGVYYESIKEALLASSEGSTLDLYADATLEEAVDLTKSATIDLNQNRLTLNGQLSIKGSSEKSATLTLKNGFLNSSASGADTYGIAIEANGALEISDVEYFASPRAIKIKENADNASLKITNSQIISNGGAMAIQTDATIKDGKASQNVTIEITNSHIEAKNCKEGGSVSEDTTALLFNIDGTLTIKDSTLIGDRQGVIVRGGTATISNSTIISSGTRTNYYDSGDYVNKNWGSGSEVPLAALVIGNRTLNSYKYSTTVTLDNVTLSTPNERAVRKSIYVYQNDTTNTVTVTGNIKGEYTINGDFNGAEVSDICTVKQVSNNTSTTVLFGEGSSSKKNISVNLSDNTTLSLSSGTFHEGSNSKNVTLIGKLDSHNNPVSTVDIAKESTVAEGAKHLNYQRGSVFTFENLTIVNGTDTYDGIVCDELVYKNCVIKGVTTLYGKATFINCTFENDMANQYSIWTWGGTDVTFENCTFNTNGKAILMFGEEKTTTLSVQNCKFNDRNNGSAGKAAIEVGEANYGKHNNFNLNISNSTVETGFAINNEGSNTGTKLWANKNSMDAAHLTVTIDGNKIQ